MKISFAQDSENRLFIISDYPLEYVPIFESGHFSRENERYVKGFAKKTQNIEQIQRNFAQYAEEMYAQLAGMIPNRWEEALSAFIERTQDQDIEWWLTGSCALSARGVAVIPHDIDIMLRSKDIKKLNIIFADCIVEPIRDSTGWVVKIFGVMFLHIRFDLAFDPESWVDTPNPADFGPYARAHLEEINWNDSTIKVPPLELQLKVNRRRGRVETARAIEEYLGKQT